MDNKTFQEIKKLLDAGHPSPEIKTMLKVSMDEIEQTRSILYARKLIKYIKDRNTESNTQAKFVELHDYLYNEQELSDAIVFYENIKEKENEKKTSVLARYIRETTQFSNLQLKYDRAKKEMVEFLLRKTDLSHEEISKLWGVTDEQIKKAEHFIERQTAENTIRAILKKNEFSNLEDVISMMPNSNAEDIKFYYQNFRKFEASKKIDHLIRTSAATFEELMQIEGADEKMIRFAIEGRDTNRKIIALIDEGKNIEEIAKEFRKGVNWIHQHQKHPNTTKLKEAVRKAQGFMRYTKMSDEEIAKECDVPLDIIERNRSWLFREAM